MTHTLLFSTALGEMVIRGDGESVTCLSLAEKPEPQHPAEYLLAAADEVREFLEGKRKTLDFPINPKGTPFQRQVWEALRQIPYGQTETYGELARRIGRPGAARAVGSAAGKNPCLLIIPCHRLLAAAGLGGFALGLEIKARLLSLEGGHAQNP